MTMSDTAADLNEGSEREETGRQRLLWAFLTVAVVVFAALPFFLFTRPIWDGWLYARLVDLGKGEAILRPFIDNGRPIGGYLLRASMTLWGAIIGPKLASTISLAIAGLALFYTLVRCRITSMELAFAAAVIAVATPATFTFVTLTQQQFFIGLAVFCIGLACFLTSEFAVGLRSRILYSVGVMLGAASALIAEAPLALLPLYTVGLVALRAQKQQELDLYAFMRLLVLHSAPFVAGIAVFLSSLALFPLDNGYEGTHQLVTSVSIVLRNFAGYLTSTAAAQVFLVAVLVCILGMRVLRRHVIAPLAERGVTQPFGHWMLGAGICTYLAGISLYILARRTTSGDWGERCLLFSGIGVAMVVLYTIDRRGFISRIPGGRRTIAIAVALAVVANQALAYPRLAARQMKDDAFSAAIAGTHTIDAAGLVVVHDSIPTYARPRNYELTGLLHSSREGQQAIVMHAKIQRGRDLVFWLDYLTHRFPIVPANPNVRCVVDIFVDAVRPLDSETVIEGLFRRATLRYESYLDWLKSKIRVSIKPRDSCSS